LQDTKIKGTGNSRTLKMPANALTIYPTWEAFVSDCSTVGAPIDIGPLNLAGVDTMGTDLSKANLLKDTTAALYGLGVEAVPDDVLAKISSLITTAQSTANGKAQVAIGTYSGTGQATRSLYFPFVPKFFIIIEASGLNGNASYAFIYGCNQGYSGFKADTLSVTWSGASVTFTHSHNPSTTGAYPLNESYYGYIGRYYYVVVG